MTNHLEECPYSKVVKIASELNEVELLIDSLSGDTKPNVIAYALYDRSRLITALRKALNSLEENDEG